MTDSLTLLATASFALAGLAIVVLAALKGWQGWLDLKRLELAGDRREGQPAIERIEIADLKERVRKLESIAACIDL